MPWWQWMLVYRNSTPWSISASRWPMEMPLTSANMEVFMGTPWLSSRVRTSSNRRERTSVSSRSQKLR